MKIENKKLWYLLSIYFFLIFFHFSPKHWTKYFQLFFPNILRNILYKDIFGICVHIKLKIFKKLVAILLYTQEFLCLSKHYIFKGGLAALETLDSFIKKQERQSS